VSFTTNKPRFIFSGFFTILFSLFLVSGGFTANKNRINRSTLQNDQQSNQSQMKDTRSIMPGLIIVKFKENMSGASSAALRSIPSIEAKTAKYQGYTLDQAFPFLQNSRAAESANLNRIFYFRYTSSKSPAEVAEDFSRDPNVEYAEPKYIYPLLDTPNDAQYAAMTQFPHVQAPAAWDVVKGDSGDAIIAIVDGGTEWDHEDLMANVWNNSDEIPNNGIDDDNNGFIDDVRGWNFQNNSNDPTGSPSTPESAAHGTHTAGTAAGVTNNGIGVASISWNCTLMPINTASPTTDRAIAYGYEGITYAADNGADVINCSWGGIGAASRFEQDVIDFAYANGALVVAAAGNDGVNNDLTPHYPSSYDKVLSVGATNKTSDAKASFSEYGVTVDVYAPGVSILSTTPNNTYQSSFWSGTSMASPMAAGLAGLVKTQNPGWTVDQVREQVRVTCDDITASNVSLIGLLGKGRINALRAVTEFTNPSIRVNDVTFLDSGGDGVINAGETVDVTVSFINYLASTSNVSFTLTDNDNNITINNASGNVSTFNTNETHDVTFQFAVASGVPDGYILRLYLDISDGSYTDRDFFQLIVNPPQFVTHNTGPLQTAITTQGNIGWIDFQGQSGGVGFVFNGIDYLFEGGLMIGTGQNTVSDCIRGSDGQTQDDDFEPANNEFLSLTSPGSFTTEEGSILLVDSLATNPLGVRVLQKSYADTTTGKNGFVIFSYRVSNPTASPLSNVYVGLFFDWDIFVSGGVNNSTRFDQSRKMGYVQNSVSSANKYAAARLLTSTANISYRSINNQTELFDADGFSNLEKWNFLSGGIQTQSLDNMDISMLIGEGPFNIPAGGFVTVAFALAGGNSLAELEANADAAQNLWNNPSVGIDPITEITPDKFNLEQNYPNPFNPSTTIPFTLGKSANVSLKIFNIVGQEVRTLVNGHKDAGQYTLQWDSKDNFDRAVASGIYFYKLSVSGTENLTLTRKMILMK
jgi:serine protease